MHTNIQIDVTDFSTLSIVLGRNTYSLLETGLSSDSDVERTWHMLCYGPFKKNSLSLDQWRGFLRRDQNISDIYYNTQPSHLEFYRHYRCSSREVRHWNRTLSPTSFKGRMGCDEHNLRKRQRQTLTLDTIQSKFNPFHIHMYHHGKVKEKVNLYLCTLWRRMG